MDIRKVKKLIELLEASGMAEIEITEGDDSVRIVRHAPMAPVSTQISVPPSAAPAATIADPDPEPQVEPEADVGSSGQTITAPMVGTFYRAPTPGSAPFVDIGKEIATGDTICIIEAMKMMNQIEADRGGRIKDILASDGEPVEFGQPLFVIE